jgi:hypothetical protein
MSLLLIGFELALLCTAALDPAPSELEERRLPPSERRKKNHTWQTSSSENRSSYLLSLCSKEQLKASRVFASVDSTNRGSKILEKNYIYPKHVPFLCSLNNFKFKIAFLLIHKT